MSNMLSASKPASRKRAAAAATAAAREFYKQKECLEGKFKADNIKIVLLQHKLVQDTKQVQATGTLLGEAFAAAFETNSEMLMLNATTTTVAVAPAAAASEKANNIKRMALEKQD